MSRLEGEGMSQEILESMRQEAAQALQNDPPEVALTLTGQMAAALRQVAQKQDPLQPDMVFAVNSVTEMMIQFLWDMGWHLRAIKTEDGWKYESPPA